LSHNKGVCEHLTDDNKCAIYEDRPADCVIWQDAADDELTLQYWMETASICNEWMDEDESECERITLDHVFTALKPDKETR
jgi:Fe-S-cluster containining protein